MKLANIMSLIEGLYQETEQPVAFEVKVEEGLWTARVFDQTHPTQSLYDPNGDGKLLRGSGTTPEIAIERLEQLCWVRPPVTEEPVYRKVLDALQAADELGGIESRARYAETMRAIAGVALERAATAEAHDEAEAEDAERTTSCEECLDEHGADYTGPCDHGPANGCDECERHHGPHYTGPCEHGGAR